MKQLFNSENKLIGQLVLLLTLLGFQILISAQPHFIKNQGQFKDNVQYKLKHKSGNIYFEKNKITYQLFEKEKLYKIKHQQTKNPLVKGHVYTAEFIGSNFNTSIKGQKITKTHHNYYLGSDSSKWAKKVPLFNELKYENIYRGIDLLYYEKKGHLKYDFIIAPSHDPEQIVIEYKDANSIYLKSGHLVISTSLGNVIEQAPMAFQIINNKKKIIKCKYVLKNNRIHFEFPEGFNNNYELIIDPLLIFSTYSGSTADNWGQTATYDNSGNLYSGSIAFSLGYPTTSGAFQSSFAGGSTDICITKFSATGNNLLYSTYLGGSNNENPHSLIVNDNNELYLMGSTGSADFPTTTGSYDNVFNGGDSWGFINYGSGYYVNYPNGIDIIVAKFSSSGNNLSSSTYVGGSKNDGINESGANTYNNSGLCNFYADEYRGEINLDDQGNCYIASTSTSLDFPVISASQSSNAGLQDAVVFKLDPSLSNLMWSTYYGGSDNDAAYSVQINSNNDIYITGGTMSNDLSTSANSIQTNFGGGVDGFVANFNLSGSLNASTYIGNNGYDQCYFAQIDVNDNIFLFGLTSTSSTIFPANVYNSIGSQFIQKISSDLSTNLLTTTFGNGSLNKTITPSAFLVSDCGLIYICGWGGLNGSGTTQNLPITTGLNNSAFQSSTDNADFYLAVFEQDMQSLLYATFFGGNQSSEHVDGGTSRFDKNGKVYQAVCAGCPGNNDFPTTPGAWSSVDSSTNCNLGVFKFAFENITTAISIPNYFACLPNSYQFNSISQGGNQFFWDFGDGNVSNQMNPSHVFTDTGAYFVSLIVSDSISCVISDTAIIQVNIYGVNNAEIIGDSIICQGGSTQLTAYGGTQYIWFPSAGLSSDSTQQVIANPTSNTNYMVIAIDSCGVDTAFFNLQVSNDQYNLSNDTVICSGDSVALHANGGLEYRWNGNNILFTDSASTVVFPTQNTFYNIEITSPNGCLFFDSVYVEIDSTSPVIILDDTLNICLGDSVFLNPLNIDNAIWQPYIGILDTTSIATWSTTETDIIYYLSSENSCGISHDSIVIIVFGYTGKAFGDTSICLGDSTYVYATDGITYFWSPSENMANSDTCCSYVQPLENTDFNVIIESIYGCKDTFDVQIFVKEIPYVDAGDDQWINFGESANLLGNINSPIFYWETSSWMSCNNCLSPQISPSENTTYVLHGIDSIGCKNSDSVIVNLKGSLFVPNTFTPNNDGANDFFEVKGEFVKDYKIWVFNRWGELVYHSSKITESWDGFFKNTASETGGYIWEIEFSDFSNEKKVIKGHLNLIR